jgi:hypothetical protein
MSTVAGWGVGAVNDLSALDFSWTGSSAKDIEHIPKRTANNVK